VNVCACQPSASVCVVYAWMGMSGDCPVCCSFVLRASSLCQTFVKQAGASERTKDKIRTTTDAVKTTPLNDEGKGSRYGTEYRNTPCRQKGPVGEFS
jgi:hypothetical protein